MRNGAKYLLGTLAVTGGIATAALISTPAEANSCFWVDTGQRGSSRCYSDNVQDFNGQTFPNGTPMRAASSYQNTNLIWNDYVYSERNYSGQSQELEDETLGNLDPGIADHLGSYDAN
jgi:hypothetical protein